VRRYQLESPGSSARIDAKLHVAAVEAGVTPGEAEPGPANGIKPMDIDSVSEVPKQEGVMSHEESNGTTQSLKEEDLFGDNTVTEPVSAMSPPRY